MYSGNDIRVGIKVSTREEAIRESSRILVDKNKITPEYIDEILEVLEVYGPYFVLSPGIAFPHSKPSESVLETGMSLITLETPVVFGNEQNDPVDIVCTLASKTGNDHLELLKRMVAFLSDLENQKILRSAKTEEDIKSIVEVLNSIEIQ